MTCYIVYRNYTLNRSVFYSTHFLNNLRIIFLRIQPVFLALFNLIDIVNLNLSKIIENITDLRLFEYITENSLIQTNHVAKKNCKTAKANEWKYSFYRWSSLSFSEKLSNARRNGCKTCYKTCLSFGLFIIKNISMFPIPFYFR